MVQPYFISSLNDEMDQVFTGVGENIMAVIPYFLRKQFLSSFSMF